MNKFGIVLGAAAVATLAGCKDPDYKYASASPSQGEVKTAETTITTIEPALVPTCQCAPGTRHTSPCRCGAPDCKCVVATKPVYVAPVAAPVAPAPTPAPAPAPVSVEASYTEYVVQQGDYLAKISKRYNVTLAALRRANPSIKKDVIRVGQKIKIPGKADVGVQAEPVKAVAAKTTKKTVAATYSGSTKEYVVKNGDTLGSIAYGNGINIRQLKKLNGLTKDTLKVGQKLKVPAEKGVVAASPAKKEAVAAPVAEKKSATAAVQAAVPVVEEKKPETPAAVEEKKPDAAASEAPAPASASTPATTTYVVQEGDDMTGVSIRWGVSAAEIRELNNLGENDQLVPGQIIKLPAEAQQ